MNLLRPCIYCKGPCSDSKGRAREHVIPQAFGTFGTDTPTLHCVCDACNAAFAKVHDQLLARETHEGITRYQKGKLSKEARDQRRLEIRVSDEAAGWFNGMSVWINGTTGNIDLHYAQFLILNQVTGEEEAYLPPQIPGLRLPDNIYGGPGSLKPRQCRVIGSSREKRDALIALLNANGIPYRPGPEITAPLSSLVGPDGELGVEIGWMVDPPYRRALAKVIMNLAAKKLGTEVVFSERWDPLRLFIHRGAGDVKWRRWEDPIWPGAEKLPDNGINIRIWNHREGIVGSIQFYGHPTYDLLMIVGARLEQEVAVRFVAGQHPLDVVVPSQ